MAKVTKIQSAVTGDEYQVQNLDVQQSTGQSTEAVMSQKSTTDALATKQGTIGDLQTIRSGAAAGATAYQKPSSGIPSSDMASGVQTSLGKADTAIQPGNVKQTAGESTGDVMSQKAVTDELDKKANKDGYYETLTAGMAENLVGQSESTDTFTTETTGGESDFGNGLAELAKIEGNGLAWNQLLNPTNSEHKGVTVTYTNGKASLSGTTEDVYFRLSNSQFANIKNHKYLFKTSIIKDDNGVLNGAQLFLLNRNAGSTISNNSAAFIYNNTDTSGGTAYGINSVESGVSVTGVELYVEQIDLSLIYGLGNEPASVDVVEADLAKLIAQKPYYQPNAGELYGVKKLHIVSYGQNLLNPTNAQARLAPYDWDTNSNKYGIAFRNGASASAIQFTPDATGVAESITPDSNGIFTISGAGTLQLTMASGSAASDCYVWAVWDGKKDGIENYKPYSADALEIVVGNIYGKLNGAGDMVKVFSDDVMRATGILSTSVRDIVDAASKTADVNVANKHLGDLTFQYDETYHIFYCTLSDMKKPSSAIKRIQGIISSKYPTSGTYGVFDINDYSILRNTDIFHLTDSSHTSVPTELDPWLNGVYLWYELATPLHYTDLKLSSDGGTTFQDLPERFSVDNWGVWEQLPNDSTIPSGKDFTGVAAQITTILPMNAPEAIDTFLQQGITTAENRAQVVNILAALKAQNIIGDYSVGETPTDKVFSVSVTPYVEPENP